MFYIKLQGGARSPSLCAKAKRLWNGCIWHPINISAAYLLGIQKTTADALSRHFSHGHKWEINPIVLHCIFQRWGILQIDLFDTAKNKKFSQLCSRVAVWESELPGKCLSPPLEPRTLVHILTDSFNIQAPCKIKKEKAKVVIVVLLWLRWTWFPYSQLNEVCQPITVKHVPLFHSQVKSIISISGFSSSQHGW